MLHIILLVLSFFCISNIQAAQESKAKAEDHTEVAIPAAASLGPTAPQTAKPHAPGPWQTLTHSILPAAPLWPIIFGYSLDAQNLWTIKDSTPSIFLSKNSRSLYIAIDGLTKYDIDTGMLQSQSPVSLITERERSGLSREAEYFPVGEDRVIVSMGFYNDTRSVDTRSIPEEIREHHVLPKRFRSLCTFNGYLVTPNDRSMLEMRHPKALELKAEKFFQCKPGPKEIDFQLLYPVEDRFLFAIYVNDWNQDYHHSTMEVFDITTSKGSICSLPWPRFYADRPKSINRISKNRFAIMGCDRETATILNTKKKEIVEISTRNEIISALTQFGKNKLLTGGEGGTIALWLLTNPPHTHKREMAHPNNPGRRIVSLVKLNNDEFLSMDHMQCLKLWNTKKGVAMLQLQDPKDVRAEKIISLSDGYVIYDIKGGTRRLQIKNELKVAYDAESESILSEPRKAKLMSPTPAKKAALAIHTPGASSTPGRRRSLSPARPAEAAAACSASAAAGISAAIKKV